MNTDMGWTISYGVIDMAKSPGEQDTVIKVVFEPDTAETYGIVRRLKSQHVTGRLAVASELFDFMYAEDTDGQYVRARYGHGMGDGK